MNYWLLKTEPEDYSWDDLVKDNKAQWDGVKGYQALKNIAKMQKGDRAFIYHTGKERSIIGTAEIVSEHFPDPKENDNKLLVFYVAPISKLNKPVTLEKIKKLAAQAEGGEVSPWQNWELIRQPRLSIIPVSHEQWTKVIELSNQ
ncbi:EVE domain-containing protein [Desulfitibacter alkalitolerans]|uniref:EVE domain-containing protein n=1 Tax=Desulfitibacter alkalitolerans TaxID=264641 RepID=UPI00047F2B31|nr:EVE domain-containing protein [Desulfitibacter alkalitolerans]